MFCCCQKIGFVQMFRIRMFQLSREPSRKENAGETEPSRNLQTLKWLETLQFSFIRFAQILTNTDPSRAIARCNNAVALAPGL